MTNPYPIALAIGYAIGSLPFGFLISRLILQSDLRTRRLETVGFIRLARHRHYVGSVVTLGLDVGKFVFAFLFVLLGWSHTAQHPESVATVSFAGCIAGHFFPVLVAMVPVR